jgi:hypothetical protein
MVIIGIATMAVVIERMLMATMARKAIAMNIVDYEANDAMALTVMTVM